MKVRAGEGKWEKEKQRENGKEKQRNKDIKIIKII